MVLAQDTGVCVLIYKVSGLDQQFQPFSFPGTQKLKFCSTPKDIFAADLTKK